jgi:GxxExxY protein
MTQRPLIEATLTHDAIGAFYEVYNDLGYGFNEYTYKKGLEIELLARGHEVSREVAIPVHYKGILICHQFVDLLVDGRLVIEAKSTEKLPPTAARQTLNYLRVARLQIGLLMHFGPKPRYYSIVNPLRDSVIP